MAGTILTYVANVLGCGMCELQNDTWADCLQSGIPLASLLRENKDLDAAVRAVEPESVPAVFSWNGKDIFGVVSFTSGCIVCGPVSFPAPMFFSHALSGEKNESIPEGTKVDVLLFIQSLGFLCKIYSARTLSDVEIFGENFIDRDLFQTLKKDQTRITYDFVESKEGHHSFATVKNLVRCVKEGDVVGIADRIAEIIDSNTGVTTPNEFRNAKNMSIAGVTNMTNAAIEAGIHYEQAYSMSDSIISRLESCRTQEELRNTYIQGGIIFASIVAETKNEKDLQANGDSYYAVKVKEYINAKMHQPITVQQMAMDLGLSPNYLNAAFKRSEDMSLYQYIMKRKVHHAKNLLRYSDRSISDISFTLGFSSQSHFGAVFKKIVGVTPKKYKENWMSRR